MLDAIIAKIKEEIVSNLQYGLPVPSSLRLYCVVVPSRKVAELKG